MNRSFEYITTLEYKLKAANARIQAFESGERYVQLEQRYQKEVRTLLQKIKVLEKELFFAQKESSRIRNQWFEVWEEVEKEWQQKEKHWQTQKKALEQRALQGESQRDTALMKIKEQRIKLYELETALEEEKGKNAKLMAQIHRDYENSSLPSSKLLRHKKISNNREKTGRKPGGQPGHKGHGRKKQIPTIAPIVLPPPQEVIEQAEFQATGKIIKKQLVNLRVLVEVKEYHAEVYYNSKTGERIHAKFPNGVVNEVNYGGSIKAFLFLLNQDCCTSIDKSRAFLSDITEGKLQLSKGMINKLSQEFALKSEAERKSVFADLLLCPVLHTDATNAKVNGKSAYVYVCATPEGKALYVAREKKGHKGVKGTVVENYQGILVHDHESTFYRYGTNHQECLAHVLRYLKNSMENEPERTWNKEMRVLIQEMIHYRNSCCKETEVTAEKVRELEERYRKILEQAKEEYEEVPPSEYYKEGYHLYLRMKEYEKNHLLFLHDNRVPTTNNEAERLLRSYKRKQQQAMTFRSFEQLEFLCECMSMLVLMRQKEERNLFQRVAQIFG